VPGFKEVLACAVLETRSFLINWQHARPIIWALMVLISAPDLCAARVASVELDSEHEWSSYEDLMYIRAYWEAKRSGRFAPRRADIDPADLKELLPRIMLADVSSTDPLDFRYRLSGTALNAMLSGEQTGKRPRDLAPPAYGAMVHAHYSLAVERREPIFHLVMLDSRDRVLTYARLLLPLSEDGARVTMLISVHSKLENSRALRDFFLNARRPLS
jgi:hypothetical protein